MDSSGNTTVQRGARATVPQRWPILAPMVLLGIALLLRILDIYVLHLDELLGEIILSKTLGFALVVGYTCWVGESLAAIGLHSRRLTAALAIGAGLTVASFAMAGLVTQRSTSCRCGAQAETSSQR